MLTGLSDGRILVTGAAGFIGSALVAELNHGGRSDIVVVDQLGASEKWKNLAPLAFDDYLESHDLFPRLASGALGNFAAVFHLGACSSTTERDASYLIRNNYEFTKDLAQWSIENGARFVYASSAATYGDGSAGMSDAQDDTRTLARLRPLNAYGYSKQLFDLWAAREAVLDHMVGLKYFNVFGPNEQHKGDMRSMVVKGCEQILATGRLRLFKSHHPDYQDGEQKRDFLYVKDAVAMTIHLASTPTASGLYNIASGAARTWLDLGRALFAALGREAAIEFIEMPEELRGAYQYFTQGDVAKLRASGYGAPVTSLEAAVADTVKNYLVPGKRLGD